MNKTVIQQTIELLVTTVALALVLGVLTVIRFITLNPITFVTMVGSAFAFLTNSIVSGVFAFDGFIDGLVKAPLIFVYNYIVCPIYNLLAPALSNIPVSVPFWGITFCVTVSITLTCLKNLFNITVVTKYPLLNKTVRLLEELKGRVIFIICYVSIYWIIKYDPEFDLYFALGRFVYLFSFLFAILYVINQNTTVMSRFNTSELVRDTRRLIIRWLIQIDFEDDSPIPYDEDDDQWLNRYLEDLKNWYKD